jgi:hypothetical protein
MSLLMLGGTATLLVASACGPAPPAAHPVATPARAASAEPRAHVAVDVREVRRALTAAEAADYIGDATCTSCHRDIGAAHAQSAHAHTLRPVTLAEDGPLFRHANAVRDQKNHFTYATVVRDNRCQQLVFTKKVEATLPADYAVGSGGHAIGYLNRDDENGWVSLRLGYYANGRRWDLAAGQPPERPLYTSMGIELTGPLVTACLLCHTTVLRATESVASATTGEVDPDAFPDVEASSINVGCERCHGPGRAHVEAVTHSANPAMRDIVVAKRAHETFGMEDLGRAGPKKINQLCGYCHRTAENTDANDPHQKADIPRFEGAALAWSACYRKSGALSCITCHDPHKDASHEIAGYEAVCLRCHNPGASHARVAANAPAPAIHLGRICPVNPRTGCVRCHMPRQTLDYGPGVTFTNHWIKVWRKPHKSAAPH